MKSLFAQLAMVQRNRARARNLRVFAKVMAALAVLVVVFMIIFRVLMAWEGRDESWVTAFYWVMTVMSTLGFGDIAFQGDLGRLFSMVVLLSGMVLLLVLLPFLFIELFYIPWSTARDAKRVPREVDPNLKGHVLITSASLTAQALRKKLEHLKIPLILVLADPAEARKLFDQGWAVMIGDHDLPETWRRAGVERAVLVAATGSDAHNAHVAFTVREIVDRVPVVALANDLHSVDVLQLAGATEVVQLAERLGSALARRVTGIDTVSHPIGEIEGLVIAEANARNTELEGKTLGEAELRQRVGVSVVGLLSHGTFLPASGDLVIEHDSVLLMVGTNEQFALYDQQFRSVGQSMKPVLILGGGRVGRATARSLAAGGLDYKIVEKVRGRVKDRERVIIGNAADHQVLQEAGIAETGAVVLTTHDDDMNVFLTIYCRKLRPEIQILSRSTRSRNVDTLYRAGADLVLSYGSMGADAIYQRLDSSEVLTIAEGLSVFRCPMPSSLGGKSLSDSRLRPLTGASVVAIETPEGRTVQPDPSDLLPTNGCLVLVGSAESEQLFAENFL